MPIDVGTSILVLGSIGLKGTMLMAKEGETQLLEHYNLDFIKAAIEAYENADEVCDLIRLLDECPYLEVNEGGIFKALWDISCKYLIGFDVDIFDIPVRQDTIEISNFFDINPYEMLSEKCLIALVRGGRSIVNALRDTSIPCAVIGEVTAGRDKLIRHQEGALHLRPAKDSINNFFKNRKEKL